MNEVFPRGISRRVSKPLRVQLQRLKLRFLEMSTDNENPVATGAFVTRSGASANAPIRTHKRVGRKRGNGLCLVEIPQSILLKTGRI